MKHTYTLDGARILREQWVEGEDINREIIPLYDNEDNVCGILYGDIPYYFLKNLQGDVIAITNQRGETVARYTYDAWGACTVSYDATATPAFEGGEAINIATINPFRYRSYYFDTETGLYYLQSRYYDPNLGRFLNGDELKMVGVGTPSIGSNLYQYCENEPVGEKDIAGYVAQFVAMAIGAVFGLFVQYAIDVVCNLISKVKKFLVPCSSIWDYITAALSGALAATGIGKMAAAFLGGLISVMNTVANSISRGKKLNGMDILLSAVVGVLSGLIGGSGANLKKVSGVVKVSKYVLKTAVSPKKIAMYLGKIKNAVIGTIVNGIRYILSAIAGALGGKAKTYILGLI